MTRALMLRLSLMLFAIAASVLLNRILVGDGGMMP